MFQPAATQSSAVFDETGQYRYCLERIWDPSHPRLAIVMLNPSQADGRVDDPTIRRCCGLSHQWGYGAIAVVNLFAYRSAHPVELKRVSDPIGPENDRFLVAAAEQSAAILLAWGNSGSWRGRDRIVLDLLHPYRPQWCHLGLNQTGQPRHPLYVRRGIQLQRWIKGCETSGLPVDQPRE